MTSPDDPTGVPASALQPGTRLRVPFGRREVVGVLVETAPHSDVPEDKLKAALQLLDSRPLLPPALFRLCLWAAQYYQHSLGDTLSWALPVLLRQGEPAEVRQEQVWTQVPGASLDDPDVIERFRANIPAGDFGQPEDLGPLAVYLASDAARYMTGAALVIDGGYTLW